MNKEIIEKFLNNQLDSWTVARDNYMALSKVKVKTLSVDGFTYKVQFNPARIISSAAKVDVSSLKNRKCFLCASNRPIEQKGLSFGTHYTILLNPYPIFPKHFTIPEERHVEQLISSRFSDMLDLAREMEDYVIFYNGPKCGASAPDHAHFQAGSKGFLPIEEEWRCSMEELSSSKVYKLGYLKDRYRSAFIIESENKEQIDSLFHVIYNLLPLKENEVEPMMNILAWYEDNKWIVFIFPRKKHRPDCYYAEGENNILISPASVDMGGVFITPLEKDYKKLSSDDIEKILNETCLNGEEFELLLKRIKERI